MDLAVLEEKLSNLDRRVSELEVDDKRINNKINEYNINQAIIMEQLSNINAKLDELAKKQEQFLNVPKAGEVLNKNKASMWDKVTGTAITTIVGALVGALIALILK